MLSASPALNMTTECKCVGPGYCQSLGREMGPERWHECHTIPAYTEMFHAEAAKGKYKPGYVEKRPPCHGPGTELHALLAELGLTPRESCQCAIRAQQMNEWGVVGCRQNRKEIIGWIKEEAAEASWFELLQAFKAARKTEYIKLLDPYGSLVDEAIRRAEVKEQELAMSSMKWAYGITTVPERLNDLLPRTLRSLKDAGFDTPRLFVDGCENPAIYKPLGLEFSIRNPRIRTFGNWILALAELYIREPEAQRYAIFQDDIVVVRNLKYYLAKCAYPDKGYCNLYTVPENHALCGEKQGWYPSNQKGRGAVALMFSRLAVMTILGSEHMIGRPQNADRGYRAIDGGIVTGFAKAGWQEWIHNPSLVQHTGEVSSMRNKQHLPSETFPGEDFDALTLPV